ncbi:hypothetical protein ACROSR_01475 [Roseovarius tibetensis]|uniref:hypothetical protein n=1 Tax=Roseovarius tibetensis TaxID=2685897 RepID=UPI003D7FE460
MRHQIKTLAVFILLGGCAQFEPGSPAPPDASSAPPAPEEAATPRTEEDEPSQDAQSPATGDLGLTVASLGSAKEPGLWLKTPLVPVPGRGRLTDPATGRSVEVDVMPLDAAPGAGSRLSLDGYRALGLSPTALPELRLTGLGA